MSKRTLALLAIVVASLLWSSAGVTAKMLVKDVHPFVVGFWRFFLASLCILPFYIREKKPTFTWKQLLFPSLIGALNVPLYYVGIKLTTANSATLIYTAGPLATAILSYILIREKNSLSKWIGILLGLIGVLIIVLLPIIEKGQIITGNLQGNLFIAGGMLAWTLYAIWSRRLRTDKQFSPITTTSVYFFISSAICLFLAVIIKQPLFPPQLASPSYMGVMLFAAIFLTLVTYFLFQWAIEHVSATTASFKQYIETVFAIILNAFFLGETMTFGLIIGGGLVFAGLTIGGNANNTWRSCAESNCNHSLRRAAFYPLNYRSVLFVT